MERSDYESKYGCQCNCLDISECRCKTVESKPEYEVCSECGEVIVEIEGEESYNDHKGNILCWNCYDDYLSDSPQEDIFESLSVLNPAV